MKVVINRRFGGFGLSEAAYERLIALGVPVRKYIEQKRGPDGLYLPEPANEGEVIFDRDLEGDPSQVQESLRSLSGRYWDSWIGDNRSHPLLVQVVEELGEKADGRFAKLKIVEIPDGIEWEIDEYDGVEHIAEKHQTWR